jgi:ABC-type uncharacterized transport system ATPase subunit
VIEAATAGESSLVRLSGVSKAFVAGRPVLRDVDFDVRPGEIHAVLGENGAGKSTLMNILIGLVAPDAGSLSILGQPIDFAGYGPEQAHRAGLAMVHQHATLVEEMTVEENFHFGDPRGVVRFDRRRASEHLRALSERHGLDVPVATRVEDLSVGQRQRAEILRALDRGARLLILDEPTAALTPAEIEALFPALISLREAGHAVIFISHKLDEVERMADRVSVLRRGEVAGQRVAGDLDAAELGRWMLGHDLPPLERAGRPGRLEQKGETDACLFRIAGVTTSTAATPTTGTGGTALRDVEISVGPGEIVGVAGIDGNGQRELEEVLAGVRPMQSGSLLVGGASVQPGARALRPHGVAHLSGERERAGLIPGFDLAENWVLKSSHEGAPYFAGGWLDAEAARRGVERAISDYEIVPGDATADVGTLSGGNAQKLAIAREFATEPDVLIAVNPTRGLDVGSTRFVHDLLLALRARGGGVLLISTELDEVLALADRVVVMSRGQLRSVGESASRASVGAIMLGESPE